MAAGDPIRVLVVDDSSMVRGLLRTMLEADKRIEVVGEAGDGRKAVAMNMALKPNVITMDLMMPVMGGIEAIAEIMADRAVPILVVSGQADAQLACEAVARGALDVIGKPDVTQGKAFAAKVRMLAGVPVITHYRRGTSAVRPQAPVAKPFDKDHRLIFAIASSTGGPQALAQLLGALPGDFPHPLVVAQHIAEGFAAGLAQWLDTRTPLSVRLAAEGDVLTAGVVHIAPSETNLIVTRSDRLSLSPRQPRQLYNPSCDLLLASVAEQYGPRAVGIILSGMGRDGASGLARILDAGGTTLAQDEASSVIFGMNQEAILQGHVRKVLPLDELPREMCRLAASTSVTQA